MAFRLFQGGGGGDRLEEIEAKVQQMMLHVREEFDIAASGLLGTTRASDESPRLRSIDQRVNELEREVRRELLVHMSVIGGIETPAVLVHMSIVKDIERIGDYAKNLLDLARDGANFSGLPDAAEWTTLCMRISQKIGDVATAFADRDEQRAMQLVRTEGGLLQEFDRRVTAMVSGADSGSQAVARALAYRYLKRIVAHLMNVLSAIVMPVHKLDYFDEDPEDR